MESWMDGAKPAVWWQHNPHPNSNRQSSGWHSYEKVNHRCGETGSVHPDLLPPKAAPPGPITLVMKGPTHLPICFHTLPMNLIRKSISKPACIKHWDQIRSQNYNPLKDDRHLSPHSTLLPPAIITTNYYLRAWWTWPQSFSRSWVIKNYTISKAYWPITLYNTLGKIILVTMSSTLVYIILRHNLLPPKCFSGLLGWTTMDSLWWPHVPRNRHRQWDRTRWPSSMIYILFTVMPCGHPHSWAWQWRGIHRQ